MMRHVNLKVVAVVPTCIFYIQSQFEEDFVKCSHPVNCTGSPQDNHTHTHTHTQTSSTDFLNSQLLQYCPFYKKQNQQKHIIYKARTCCGIDSHSFWTIISNTRIIIRKTGAHTHTHRENATLMHNGKYHCACGIWKQDAYTTYQPLAAEQKQSDKAS